MLGLIGSIIANQSSLQRKITMQERYLCWPPTFFLGPAVATQFFHSRIATAQGPFKKKLSDGKFCYADTS